MAKIKVVKPKPVSPTNTSSIEPHVVLAESFIDFFNASKIYFYN